jgi:hypothetical protein
LAYDLKRLDIAYLDGNVREYELTRHISLVSLAPEQLIALKETGRCEFDVPEWLFDLDTPGHYRRRIRMGSASAPSVAGPLITMHCKVQLLNSSYRKNTDLGPGYERLPTDDTRFIVDRKVVESMVTSTAQNDAGMFEPSMRDERYLPFEGAGAISRWRLELPSEFRTLDYGTISDVILHLRYTARDGGDTLKSAATEAVKAILKRAQELKRLFSLRHEFPSEWHKFVNAPSAVDGSALTVDLAAARFPYFVQGRAIAIKRATIFATVNPGTNMVIGIAPVAVPPPDLTAAAVWAGQATPGLWTLGTNGNPAAIKDIFVALEYSAGT